MIASIVYVFLSRKADKSNKLYVESSEDEQWFINTYFHFLVLISSYTVWNKVSLPKLYPSNLTFDQSEASILVSWSLSTNQRPV